MSLLIEHRTVPYRPEIDGLRAVAVLSVLGAHAGIPFLDGGFVGVDIFFVISGYLITRIIHQGLQRRDFSIWTFFERRARRILPALYITILVSLPFAYFYMLPDDLENFGQSMVATVIYSNNILLYLTSGYWGGDNELKPLLHTWSLGVEEQYYLLFPFILILLHKYKSEETGLIAITTSGFILCVIVQALNGNFSFFMLPTRFWELTAGGLLSLTEPSINKYLDSRIRHRYVTESITIAGFLALFSSVALYRSTMPFPGPLAAIPVAGTIVLILFSNRPLYFASLLKLKPLVFLGTISYSVYLVHQPVFALLRHGSLEGVTNTDTTLAMAGIALLSYISFRYIEQPFRDRTIVSTKALIYLVTAFSAAIFSIGFYLHLNSGFANNWKELYPEVTAASPGLNAKYNQSAFQYDKLPFSNDGRLKILIIGNSFARDIINMMVENSIQARTTISYLSVIPTCLASVPPPKQTQALLDTADIIVYGSLPTSTDCVVDDVRLLQLKPNRKVFVVGPKNFGHSLGAVMRIDQSTRYSYRTSVVEEILERNAFQRGIIPKENYIDLIALMSDKLGRVPVFTDRNLFISQDREHLTKDGARFIGEMLLKSSPLGRAVREES